MTRLPRSISRRVERIKHLAVRTRVKIAVVVFAILLAVLPIPPQWIEKGYSTTLYPRLQSIFTSVTNFFPFAVFDLLLVSAAAGGLTLWVYRIRRAARGTRLRAAGVLFANTIVFAAAAFLLFEAMWGFNYMRVPLASKLDFSEERFSPQSLSSLKRATVERLNQEAALARTGNWPGEYEWRDELRSSLDEVIVELGHPGGMKTARPKRSLVDFYMAASGVNGFLNPFGHEVILNAEALPVEKPFLLAHEWAHLAGFADESEANFVGLLACLRSPQSALRYSGWLSLYGYLPWQVASDPLNVGAPQMPGLSAEVLSDLKAIDERVARSRSATVSLIQGEVYDQFLKANRVEEGIASYGLLVRLMLGTRFEPDWVPAQRR